MSLDAGARNGRVRGNGIVTDDTLMTLALMDIYGDSKRHLDAWDMADGMVRQIAWTPRWIPELGRETMLIERLFYPEKWIFQRHQLSNCDPRQGGIGNMVNCGAAMYIAPIGVVNAAGFAGGGSQLVDCGFFERNGSFFGGDSKTGKVDGDPAPGFAGFGFQPVEGGVQFADPVARLLLG